MGRTRSEASDPLISHSEANFVKALLILLAAFAVSFTGCEKGGSSRSLSAAEIHGITQDLAAAAAARGAAVKIRKSAVDGTPSSRDAIQVSLRTGAPGSAAAVADLLQSLDYVVTRHKLTRDAPTASANSMHILLRRAGRVTHEIEIETSPVASTGKSSAGAAPRLAIILDDLGGDRAAAEAIFALHCPLTVSILPGHEHSTEIAEEAHRRGLEIMLHLPMESIGKEQPEAQELRSGMSAPQVAALVDDFLTKVPYAAGVNNHQGSEATSNSALMSELMPLLRDKQLFYIDSRTTAATVAYEVAQKAGVPSAFRNVPFLDDIEDVAAVRKQLVRAASGAKEKREAIAIGHPHPATLQALREFLPEAKAEGIQLVAVSELVH